MDINLEYKNRNPDGTGAGELIEVPGRSDIEKIMSAAISNDGKQSVNVKLSDGAEKRIELIRYAWKGKGVAEILEFYGITIR